MRSLEFEMGVFHTLVADDVQCIEARVKQVVVTKGACVRAKEGGSSTK